MPKIRKAINLMINAGNSLYIVRHGGTVHTEINDSEGKEISRNKNKSMEESVLGAVNKVKVEQVSTTTQKPAKK